MLSHGMMWEAIDLNRNVHVLIMVHVSLFWVVWRDLLTTSCLKPPLYTLRVSRFVALWISRVVFAPEHLAIGRVAVFGEAALLGLERLDVRQELGIGMRLRGRGVIQRCCIGMFAFLFERMPALRSSPRWTPSAFSSPFSRRRGYLDITVSSVLNRLNFG